MTKFAELPLSALLKENLSRNGFIDPTPIQDQTFEHAIAGRDLVATAQTGTGKTLAFVLPMVQLLSAENSRGVRALVLSPTRELAMQIGEVFAKVAKGTGLRAAVVVGGLNERTQLTTIRKGVQVVIATPGRLWDFLGRGLIDLKGTRMLVLDEADRMLDMGFLPAIRQILSLLPAERQTMLFSATIENSVKQLVATHVRDAVRIELGSISKPSEQVDLHFYEVEQEAKLPLLHRMLRDEKGSFLVFARTKHGAEKLAKRLGSEGVKSAAIHGDRSQNQRIQALKGFQDGYYRVLVATDVAARGIHVEGISQVVNYDLPQAPGDFIHRVGRTGRAGTRGTATTFGGRSERGDVALIERTLSIRMTHRNTDTGEVMERRDNGVVFMPSNAPRKGRTVYRSIGRGRGGVRRAV
jgi:ATP-dependent RNA helicase RhlE